MCSLGKNATTNSLAAFGLNFVDLSKLAEYGLVIPSIGIASTYSSSVSKGTQVPVYPIHYRGRHWALRRVEADNQTFDDYKLEGVGFSAIGHELYTVVDPIETPKYTDKLMEFFRSQALQMVELEIPL